MKQQSKYRNRQQTGKYISPFRGHFWVALVLVIALTVPLVLLKFPIYLAYMVSLNVVIFGFYGYDKSQAKKGGWRVPEIVLHFLAAIGGAPGGIAAQWFFHHKTRKQIFHIMLWLSLVVHLLFFAAFYQALLTSSDLPGGIKALIELFNPPKRR